MKDKCIQSFGWKGKEHSGDLIVDGRIILKCILETSIGMRTGLNSGFGSMAASCEHGNESSGSM
jgi:hypothetical protein